MDLDQTFILETIFFLCNISLSLCARNKVKYFFQISMARAFKRTPWFLSYVLVGLRYDPKRFVRFFLTRFMSMNTYPSFLSRY